MVEPKNICMLYFLLSFLSAAFAADVVLNEYNAVSSSLFLNGGNTSVDSDGGQASDGYFGRVTGNGGDWFELIVITDHLDMRDWDLDIYEDGAFNETLELTSHDIWSDLRSGTIITISEDVESDISYNPQAGDWWINVQASNSASGVYITPSNFVVNNNDWQLVIIDDVDNVIFGPAGEGISPTSGIGDTETFRLEATPDAYTSANSPDYDDGKTLSTFGAPNQWGQQELNLLRTVVAEPSGILLYDPNGVEIIAGGTIHNITWETIGTIDSVLIEFSVDNGKTWSEVYPPNIGNSGVYDWLVPIVNSEQCKVRLTNPADISVFDISDGAFTIYECPLEGDLTGDCLINLDDLAIMASYWLQEENPYE